MTYLNEYEALDAYNLFMQDDTVANLQKGAYILLALIEWTNSCSDGWTYWRKPREAASGLVHLIEHKRREYLRGNPVLDITHADLKKALVPIKSFLTRQGIDHGTDLPWAAILPETAKALPA